MGASSVYTLLVYLNTYLNVVLGVPLTTAISIETSLLIMTLIFVPIFGHLSDRFGRRIILSIAALGMISFSLPIFYYLQDSTLIGIIFLLIPLILFLSMEQGTMPATMSENFPAKVRYTGISLGYNLGYSFFGGTAPLINAWLIHKTDNPLIPAFYLIIMASISLIIIIYYLYPYHGEKLDLLDQSIY